MNAVVLLATLTAWQDGAVGPDFRREERRTLRISGSRGELRGVLQAGKLEVTRHGAPVPEETIEIAASPFGHSGGDQGLLDHFCDAQRCYPVVGGALVKKDPGHLTALFARTLAPYLQRELRRVMASWR